MTVEEGTIELNELEVLKVLDLPFGVKQTTNENGIVEATILPFPFKDVLDEYNRGRETFSYETLLLLYSKDFTGIKHRTQMLQNVFNTFKQLYDTADHTKVDTWLTLQTLYLDMVTKLGAILEDFAGMCYSCREFILRNQDISRTFLAYSDPISFYKSISSKSGKRMIKQIFNLPESKGDLDKKFQSLNDEDKNLLWEAVSASVNLIHEKFLIIASAINRNQKDDVTYYDLYNKIKHGFSPINLFRFPMPTNIPILKELSDVPIEEIIFEYYFKSITIMHDKLPGQRSMEEQVLFNENQLATPTFISQSVNLDTASEIIEVAMEIDTIYKHLIKTYLLIAENNKQLILLMSDDCLTSEERDRVGLIINDQARYI